MEDPRWFILVAFLYLIAWMAACGEKGAAFAPSSLDTPRGCVVEIDRTNPTPDPTWSPDRKGVDAK